MTGNKFFLSFVAQDDLHFCIVSIIISNKNNSVWLLLTTLLTTLLIKLLLCMFKITSILVYYLLHYVYKDICYKLWHVTSLWRDKKTRTFQRFLFIPLVYCKTTYQCTWRHTSVPGTERTAESSSVGRVANQRPVHTWHSSDKHSNVDMSRHLPWSSSMLWATCRCFRWQQQLYAAS